VRILVDENGDETTGLEGGAEDLGTVGLLRRAPAP